MASKKKKSVKFLDSSLLNNDELRPWTIDLKLDQRLQQESIALDKILSFTTPQKFAGTLASSVLDSTPREFVEFRSTLQQNKSGQIGRASPEAPLSGKNSNRSNPDSSRSEGVSGKKQLQVPLSRSSTPMSETYQDLISDSDLEYIDRLKKSIYMRSMSKMRAQTANSISAGTLSAIRYTQQPFGPISPTKSKLVLTSYHNPKFVKFPPIGAGKTRQSAQLNATF
jgi:hypothetical protein